MKKSTFLAASWFLFLVALIVVLVGVVKVPVKTWPREQDRLSRARPPVLSDSQSAPAPAFAAASSASSVVIPSRLPRAGLSR